MNKNHEYLPDGSEQRVPPHSVEAEQGVLGCVFLDPAGCLAACIERLRAGALCFYDLRHQTIYSCLAQMFERREAIDVITVQQRLKDAGTLEQVGGIAYLAALPDTVPSASNLETYLAVLRDKFRLRKLLACCGRIVQRVYDHAPEQVEQMLADIESEVTQLTEEETTTSERHMRVIVGKNLEKLESWHYRQGSAQIEGLTTGPEGNYFDKMLAGIADDDMGVIAGRPGSGKTSLALNFVKHVARDHVWWEDTGKKHPREEGDDGPDRPVMLQHKGMPVAIFSLEMTGESLGMRLIFDEAGVDMALYRTGYKSAGDDKKLFNAAAKLASANIYIDDTASMTISQVAAKARRMARQHGIKLFVLDYLQLIDSESERSNDRVRELEKVAKKIIALKKQLQIPWVVLAQMNRNIETSEREREPVMSDLKDCGAIEQAADWIVFTYKTPHKEVTAEKELANGQCGPSDAEIIAAIAEKNQWGWGATPYRVDLVIAKHRDGPVGKVQTVFQKNLCRFFDWHLFKVQHGAEDLKAGEREKVVKPKQTVVDYGD